MNSASDLALFFGRFHPVLVHLPIGLVVLLVFLEVLSRFERFKHANANAGLILSIGVPFSILTALMGWLLSREGGYDERLLQLHLWTGIGTAALILISALFNWFGRPAIYRVSIFSSFLLLLVASHFGGSLTHGSDYLVRYAPARVRNLLAGGGNPPVRPPAVPETGELPAFAVLIQPMLHDKCISCHGPEKTKGGLRVDSFEALVTGGDSGPAIVRGSAEKSELVRRILLPPDDDEHMPPDGKPQPERDEVEILRWWVDAGADPKASISALNPPTQVKSILDRRLGPIQTRTQSQPDEAPPKPATEIQDGVARLAEELEVPITFLGQGEPWLQANAGIAGKRFGDSELQKLAGIGANVKWLDLTGTAVSNSGLTNLARFPNLVRLYLGRTAITDEGMGALLTLRQLEYLNLFGTTITDQGVSVLGQSPRLRQLYLWQTMATPAGGEAFTKARVDEGQIRRWEEEIEELKTRIRNQAVIVNLGVTPQVSNTPPAVTQRPVNSTCPVSGRPVDPTKTSSFDGRTVAFCCDDCKAKFEADPTAFASGLATGKPAESPVAR